jgi:hypothetical protein
MTASVYSQRQGPHGGQAAGPATGSRRTSSASRSRPLAHGPVSPAQAVRERTALSSVRGANSTPRAGPISERPDGASQAAKGERRGARSEFDLRFGPANEADLQRMRIAEAHRLRDLREHAYAIMQGLGRTSSGMQLTQGEQALLARGAGLAQAGAARMPAARQQRLAAVCDASGGAPRYIHQPSGCSTNAGNSGATSSSSSSRDHSRTCASVAANARRSGFTRGESKVTLAAGQDIFSRLTAERTVVASQSAPQLLQSIARGPTARSTSAARVAAAPARP